MPPSFGPTTWGWNEPSRLVTVPGKCCSQPWCWWHPFAGTKAGQTVPVSAVQTHLGRKQGAPGLQTESRKNSWLTSLATTGFMILQRQYVESRTVKYQAQCIHSSSGPHQPPRITPKPLFQFIPQALVSVYSLLLSIFRKKWKLFP